MSVSKADKKPTNLDDRVYKKLAVEILSELTREEDGKVLSDERLWTDRRLVLGGLHIRFGRCVRIPQRKL